MNELIGKEVLVHCCKPYGHYTGHIKDIMSICYTPAYLVLDEGELGVLLINLNCVMAIRILEGDEE